MAENGESGLSKAKAAGGSGHQQINEGRRRRWQAAGMAKTSASETNMAIVKISNLLQRKTCRKYQHRRRKWRHR